MPDANPARRQPAPTETADELAVEHRRGREVSLVGGRSRPAWWEPFYPFYRPKQAAAEVVAVEGEVA